MAMVKITPLGRPEVDRDIDLAKEEHLKAINAVREGFFDDAIDHYRNVERILRGTQFYLKNAVIPSSKVEKYLVKLCQLTIDQWQRNVKMGLKEIPWQSAGGAITMKSRRNINTPNININQRGGGGGGGGGGGNGGEGSKQMVTMFNFYVNGDEI